MIARNYPFKIKQIPTNKRAGKVIPNPEHRFKQDEKDCADILARFGDNVIFLPEHPYLRSADCKWRKEIWEIKTLSGNSKLNTIHAIEKASKQSNCIIINASKTKRDMHRLALDAMYSFHDIKANRPDKILILTKDQACLILRSMVK